MNLKEIREEFPILTRSVYEKPLVYFDNAATTLKPRSVIDAISSYYSYETANVHRGIHFLSSQATDKYESSRKKLQKFINAKEEAELIFTSGTTAAINLVAYSYARNFLNAGDTILLTEMEHHSNIVPWQIVAKEKGLKIAHIPINDLGEWDFDKAKAVFDKSVKLVVFNYVSNSLGTINPIRDLIALAKSRGAKTCIDAAQAVAHFPLDVQELDCDFLAFSSHKLFGPTGLGVLYGKIDLLEAMPPFLGGGDMIKAVNLKESTWNDLPHKFEAGTPHIAGVIGLGAAIDFVTSIGFDKIKRLEDDLHDYTAKRLKEIGGIRFFGEAKEKVPIYSFNIEGIHATDLATYLDQQGVAVRTGHHCTMPALQHFNIQGMARASLSFYNTKEEVDILVDAIEKAKTFFL